MNMNNIVEANGLRKYFRIKEWAFGREIAIRAVDGVDLSIKKGKTLGLVGESGCGKTTTCKLILRLIEPDEGKVRFDGIEIAKLGEAELRKLRPKMQMVLQDVSTAFNPRMRIRKIISEPLEICSVSKKEGEERLKEVAEDAGISPSLLDKYPHQLSAGQKQRAGLARALILKPKLLVADEPVSHLDISIQAQILNLLKTLKEKQGLSYLFVAHDLEAVRFIADRVAVMYLGKILESASCEAIFTKPMHPYTMALLAAKDMKARGKGEEEKEKILLQGEPPSPVSPPSGCRFHTRCPVCEKICKEEEPEMKKAGKEHFVACHFVE